MAGLLQGSLCLLFTFLGIGVWHRLGRGDAAVGPEAHRKWQRHPVATVGGTAIVLAWLVALLHGSWWVPETLPGLPPDAHPGVVRWAVIGALGIAWGVGFVDDWRRAGLGALGKLVGQGIAGGLLSLPWWFADASGVGVPLAWTLLWAAAAIVALNAWNFFDNADGAATSLAALGLLPAAPLLAAAPLGFLVPNLLLRRRGTRSPGRPGDPLAYLGDSGSHLLGLALLVFPAAWPALLVPLLDLVRVCLLRLSLGEPPWRGDRRHLAHRLQRAGLAPLPVALVLVLLAAPAVLHPGPAGLLATTLGFLAAVLLTARQR